MDTSIHNILTGNIKPSPMNPRKSFNEDALRELADNISRQGLLQPITVRPLSSIDGATVVA
ncbi:MAG: ParB N-terminal domain-containing protein, partial [Prevotella sp.]|nr:ParB N-terminal domain-containing protein [Prevotella sp.]